MSCSVDILITAIMAVLAAWALGYGAGMRHYEKQDEEL